MKFVFIDLDDNFARAIGEEFLDHKNVSAMTTPVEDMQTANTAFVSPANCLCYMDGGIDYVYSREMFPRCEKVIRRRLVDMAEAGKNNLTLLGRPYLPIGSAMCYTAVEESNTILIASPTMLQPQDVSETQNARFCMFAVLQALEKHVTRSGRTIDTCVVPALCCGYGNMDPKVAAKQCKLAFDDFYTHGDRSDYTIFEHRDSPDFTVLYSQDMASTQPKYYVNSEFFRFDPDVMQKQNQSAKTATVIF